jgi:hypothetical protein
MYAVYELNQADHSAAPKAGPISPLQWAWSERKSTCGFNATCIPLFLAAEIARRSPPSLFVFAVDGPIVVAF